jgi:hypothetical protein
MRIIFLFPTIPFLQASKLGSKPVPRFGALREAACLSSDELSDLFQIINQESKSQTRHGEN